MQNKKDFVVVFTTCSFPYGNASDNAIYTYMDGIQEQGCEGEVVCLYPNSPIDHPEVSIAGEYLGVNYRYLSKRLHVSNNKFIHALDFWYYPIINIDKYLKEKTKEYNVKALFFTHVDFRFYQHTRICKKYGVQVTLVSCEYPMYLTKHPESISTYNKYSKYIDSYIFETKTLAEFEQKHIEHQIKTLVIPATMPFDDILQSEKNPSKKYIAYSGSIFSDSKDGLSHIIKAYADFCKLHPEVGLMFIGRIANQVFYESLKSLAHELNVADKITFTGEVTREEYVYNMNNATIMIVAKPKDSYYVGGLSSKVIEYLFSGNPVVMTSADDYVNYLTHKENVYFVDDNSPENLCSALCEMFENNDLRTKIAAGGKRYAMEHFNYHNLAKDILNFIR